MSTQIIPITEFKTGFDTYNQPENAPPDSFPELNNAHVFRGILQKRKGFEIETTEVFNDICSMIYAIKPNRRNK